jgi:hypothetical protein
MAVKLSGEYSQPATKRRKFSSQAKSRSIFHRRRDPAALHCAWAREFRDRSFSPN